MKPRRRLIVALILFVSAISYHPTAASAQSTGTGLEPGAQLVADAVASGDQARILSFVPAEGTVTKTAFPGGGSAVPVATARADISASVVGSQSQSDGYGSGNFKLLAVWIPAANAQRPLLLGSGIVDSERRSIAFGIEKGGDKWQIASYGAVLDLSSTLSQWQGQGDLRLTSAPQPPATGNSNEAASQTQEPRIFEIGLLLATAMFAVAWTGWKVAKK